MLTLTLNRPDKLNAWTATMEREVRAEIERADEEMFKSFKSEDFREGVAHWLEKRAPKFTGR